MGPLTKCWRGIAPCATCKSPQPEWGMGCRIDLKKCRSRSVTWQAWQPAKEEAGWLSKANSSGALSKGVRVP